jgi:hypothetical protein
VKLTTYLLSIIIFSMQSSILRVLKLIGLHGLLLGWLYFLYVDVRFSQELRPPRSVTGMALFFLYVDDVLISQELRPPRPVTRTLFLYFIKVHVVWLL